MTKTYTPAYTVVLLC